MSGAGERDPRAPNRMLYENIVKNDTTKSWRNKREEDIYFFIVHCMKDTILDSLIKVKVTDTTTGQSSIDYRKREMRVNQENRDHQQGYEV